tara:strand:+ start:1550 stop:2800 length:1251 start_codon:yes stop_codon:yes gene_type:complete
LITAILLLLLFLVAIVLVQTAIDDPGYVLISRAPHEIEISLSLFLLALFVLIISSYIILRLTIRLLHAPRDIGRWHGRRNVQLARKATLDGYARLIEGDWHAAEKTLTARLIHSTTPLLDYLGAAYAAQQQGNATARDNYLDCAQALDPAHSEAIDITRARLLERDGQIDGARDVLEQLYQEGSKSSASQGMLVSLLRLQQDWKTLEKILPDLKNSALLPKAELETAWCEVKIHRLGEKSDNDGSNAINVWASLSRKDKRNPLLLEAYCRRLMDTSKESLAEKFLRKRLTKQWEKNLVQLYGLIRTNEPLEQIQVAEGWLRAHSEDPDLLVALARLYLHVGNKDRSRSLLTEASRYGGGEESHFELGLLLEAAGEGDSALQAYRRGMARSTHEVPSLTKLPLGEILPLASEPHEPK